MENEPVIRWSSDIKKLVEDSEKNSSIVIGIDRDGTINKDLGTYVTRPEDFEPIPNSLEAIALLRKHKFQIAIISNQGGIEKGIMTQQDVDRVHDYMFKLLGEAGCPSIDALYYSASSRKGDEWAKPNVGMFKRAERENKNIKFARGGYYVGDKITDLKAAIKIGATPVLVRTGYGKETEELINKRFAYKNIKKVTKVYDDLYTFAKSLTD
jgi:D-glycero-D-manno-heptose 1,7-bisphosphate phosphatase